MVLKSSAKGRRVGLGRVVDTVTVTVDCDEASLMVME